MANHRLQLRSVRDDHETGAEDTLREQLRDNLDAFYDSDFDEGPAASVHLENVGVRYGMGPEVLRDLTFSIEPRSFQFLTGPSGAGKTTLLRLILLSV